MAALNRLARRFIAFLGHGQRFSKMRIASSLGVGSQSILVKSAVIIAPIIEIASAIIRFYMRADITFDPFGLRYR